MKRFTNLTLVLLLNGCEGDNISGRFADHIKGKRHEIQRVVKQFEASEYRKISFGYPDFFTFIELSGNIFELRLHPDLTTVGAKEELAKMDRVSLNYLEQFENTGIRALERDGKDSDHIFVDFPRGRRLLICEGNSERIKWLIPSKRSTEVLPGWHTYIE